MKRNKLEIQRNWIRIDNTFHLMIELEGKQFYKKFKVLNIQGSDSIIKINKKLKEYDMIEAIKSHFGVKKVEFV